MVSQQQKFVTFHTLEKIYESCTLWLKHGSVRCVSKITKLLGAIRSRIPTATWIMSCLTTRCGQVDALVIMFTKLRNSPDGIIPNAEYRSSKLHLCWEKHARVADKSERKKSVDSSQVQE